MIKPISSKQFVILGICFLIFALSSFLIIKSTIINSIDQEYAQKYDSYLKYCVNSYLTQVNQGLEGSGGALRRTGMFEDEFSSMCRNPADSAVYKLEQQRAEQINNILMSAIIAAIIAGVSLLFIGLVVRRKNEKSPNQNTYQQRMIKAGDINLTKQLRELKELLDADVITPEDYKNKKRDLLGKI